jgi:hypothetical protein
LAECGSGAECHHPALSIWDWWSANEKGCLHVRQPFGTLSTQPFGFVPFSKRDRRGSGVGSRRPPTGSPNHPWRSCSASRRNTTLGNLISLGQCGLNAKTAAISETCRLYFACVLRLAPSIKPHTAVSSGYRVGLHFAGLAGGAVAMRQCCRGIKRGPEYGRPHIAAHNEACDQIAKAIRSLLVAD